MNKRERSILRRLAGRSLRGKNAALRIAVVAIIWILWAIFSPELRRDDPNVCAYPEPASAPRDPAAVRVCSWNVRNYNVSGRQVGGKYVQAPKPESEKEALRKILKRINADVLLIEEMGDIAFLRELRDDLARGENLSYPYIAVTRYDSPSRLAIMSKIKPAKVLDCCDIKFPFRGDTRYSPRGALGFGFDTAGVRWYAFAIHLKSALGARKSDENFAPFRAAEAAAIDSRIADETRGCEFVIVGGDFNQEPSNYILKRFVKTRLRIGDLFDKHGQSHTYFWKKKGEYFRYDYFLATEKIWDISRGGEVYDAGFFASDHRPIYVDLDFVKLTARPKN